MLINRHALFSLVLSSTIFLSACTNDVREVADETARVLGDEFTCQVVPSPTYLPGQIVRVERDRKDPTIPNASGRPLITAIRTPEEVYSDPRTRFTARVNRTFSGDALLKLSLEIAGIDLGDIELSADRTHTVTGLLEGSYEATVSDVDRITLKKNIPSWLKIGPDAPFYYWIKQSIVSKKVQYEVTRAGGAKVTLTPRNIAVEGSGSGGVGRDSTKSLLSEGETVSCFIAEEFEVTRLEGGADGTGLAILESTGGISLPESLPAPRVQD